MVNIIYIVDISHTPNSNKVQLSTVSRKRVLWTKSVIANGPDGGEVIFWLSSDFHRDNPPWDLYYCPHIHCQDCKNIFLVHRLSTATSASCNTTLWPINRSEILHICRRYNILELCLLHWVHIWYISNDTCSIHSCDDIWRTKINDNIIFIFTRSFANFQCIS